MSPLVAHPHARLLLPPRLLGSVAYYAVMARVGEVTIDSAARYDKRAKAVHRYNIADTRGMLSLTVPVSRPPFFSNPCWTQAVVSTHDQWWHQHRITLESAYGRTPFFEFVIDRFLTVCSDPREDFFGRGEYGARTSRTCLPRAVAGECPSIIDFDAEADRRVRQFLGFDNAVDWAPPSGQYDFDLRHTKIDSLPLPPYYQVRSQKLGFISHLSILDLIFNLGPEAPQYLRSLGPAIDLMLCSANTTKSAACPDGQS